MRSHVKAINSNKSQTLSENFFSLSIWTMTLNFKWLPLVDKLVVTFHFTAAILSSNSAKAAINPNNSPFGQYDLSYKHSTFTDTGGIDSLFNTLDIAHEII